MNKSEIVYRLKMIQSKDSTMRRIDDGFGAFYLGYILLLAVVSLGIVFGWWEGREGVITKYIFYGLSGGIAAFLAFCFCVLVVAGCECIKAENESRPGERIPGEHRRSRG